MFTTILVSLPAASSADVPLEEFAKLPLYNDIKISPTGQYLAATVRNDAGESSLVIMDIRSGEITANLRGYGRDFINDFVWANNERVVAWIGTQFGSLDAPSATHNMAAVNWDGSRREWLFGRAGSDNIAFDRSYPAAALLHRLPDDDERILIAVNDYSNPDSTYTEVLKLDIYSGRTSRVTRAPARGASIVVDNEGTVRMAVSADPDNENALVVHQRKDDRWELMGEYHGKEGTVTPVAFTPDNNFLYVLDNRSTDTNSLYLLDPASQEFELLHRSDTVDIDGIELAPDGALVGLYTEPDYPHYTTIDAQHPMSEWLNVIQTTFRGYRVRPTSVTEDGTLAVIRADSDRMPPRYFLYQTDTNGMSQIVSVLPGIDAAEMRPMEPYALKVRDGTQVFAYLTRPDDSDGPFPMVVLPHGGPHGVRDYWSFDRDVQMLANRGYAVLQVNFRGSGGYGRSFLYSGYGKWGTLMQDDVTDATRWAIDSGIAEDGRICIYGGSYGGYAAVMGAVREPDLYQCVIAYVGVYDLELMFEKGDIPTREAGIEYLKQAVGEDKEDLRARSPVHNLDKLRAPVFIVHGGEDFRVDIEHANRLRDGLEELGKPYEWLVKPKEGHGFYRPENRLELYERMLTFLAKHIGARAEPVAAKGGDE
ncbi:MAG: prolyl oligopeptidase family serine peptidase [Gammaproteobacteria bacterium]